MSSNGGNGSGKKSGPDVRGDIGALARKAIAVLAAENGRTTGALRKFRLNEFCDALVHPDDSRRKELLDDFINYGVTTREIFDDLVPNAARILGERWNDDSLTFTQVTVGAARLQEIIRSFDNEYAHDSKAIPLGQRILVAVPDGQDHTLGALIAASQFRRMGLWVHLAIALSDAELEAMVSDTRFAMIGLSIGHPRDHGRLSLLIKRLRQCAPEVPIIVGGSSISSGVDLRSVLGADLVSIDLQEVFDFCGFDPSISFDK